MRHAVITWAVIFVTIGILAGISATYAASTAVLSDSCECRELRTIRTLLEKALNE